MLIEYNGIGCKGSKTIFTEDEFLKIMNDTVTHNDWILPDDFIFFTTEYSGATQILFEDDYGTFCDWDQ